MDDPVNAAISAQQVNGRPKMAEMIEVLDRLIAQRCSSMRAAIAARGALGGFDLETWGRNIYVLDEALELLRRLDADQEVRAYLRRKMREVARPSTAEPESVDGEPRQQ